jgi:hypothetical protein
MSDIGGKGKGVGHRVSREVNRGAHKELGRRQKKGLLMVVSLASHSDSQRWMYCITTMQRDGLETLHNFLALHQSNDFKANARVNFMMGQQSQAQWLRLRAAT